MNKVTLYASMFCVLVDVGCGKSSPQVANDSSSANLMNEKSGFTLQEIETPFGESFSLPVEQNKRIGIPRSIYEWRNYFRFCGKYEADLPGEAIDPMIGTMVSDSSRRINIGDQSEPYLQDAKMLDIAVRKASDELRDGPDGIPARLTEIHVYNRDGNVLIQGKIEINGWDYASIPGPISGLKIYRLNKCIQSYLIGTLNHSVFRRHAFHYYLPPELHFPEQLPYEKLYISARDAFNNKESWKEVARSRDYASLMMIDAFLPSEECREYERTRLKEDTMRYFSQRKDFELLPQN